MITDKKTLRKIREEIRKSHDNKRFYKIDKVLKITKVKINTIEKSQSKDAMKIGYEYGLNLLNPFTWILIIVPGIIEATFKGIKEIVSDMGTSKYTENILNSIIEEVKNK